MKLKKQRDHYKSNNLSNSEEESSPRHDHKSEEVNNLRDAFDKSEKIRDQQMSIIKQLRLQIEDQDKRLRMMEHQ